jgi:hypothetical protein
VGKKGVTTALESPFKRPRRGEMGGGGSSGSHTAGEGRGSGPDWRAAPGRYDSGAAAMGRRCGSGRCGRHIRTREKRGLTCGAPLQCGRAVKLA